MGINLCGVKVPWMTKNHEKGVLVYENLRNEHKNYHFAMSISDLISMYIGTVSLSDFEFTGRNEK